ncbi:MAG: SCP2 sterol-binding domain-containing protein [Shimia sp.]|jgi:putative sterol carrier protein|uniref:SCP2 sterol-binding domain-containing protein n=1 Tax=Shimia sp. TaxID=1954381 RepID=UPI0040592831
MSTVLTEAAAEISSRMASADFEDRLKIDVAGEGCLMITDAGATVGEEVADCTLSMDAATFKQIVDGDLAAAAAFMTGAITVDGDMGVALKLSPVLG